MLSVMSKILVVYYSWTGHTQEVADAIAAALGADVERIRESRPRSGWLGYLATAWEVLREHLVPIKVLEKDPFAYDLLVIGTPVWVGRMSTPVRSFIVGERHKFKRIALFCTQGGANEQIALPQIASLCGKEPVATLAVSSSDFKSGAWRAKVGEFVNALK